MRVFEGLRRAEDGGQLSRALSERSATYEPPTQALRQQIVRQELVWLACRGPTRLAKVCGSQVSMLGIWAPMQAARQPVDTTESAIL
jgi:hypothetical protein